MCDNASIKHKNLDRGYIQIQIFWKFEKLFLKCSDKRGKLQKCDQAARTLALNLEELRFKCQLGYFLSLNS